MDNRLFYTDPPLGPLNRGINVFNITNKHLLSSLTSIEAALSSGHTPLGGVETSAGW